MARPRADNPVDKAAAPSSRLPNALRPIGRSRTLLKDASVFHKGEPVRAVFLVVEGDIRLARFAPDGSEIALHRASRGDFFAEAALDSPRYHCDAIATRDTTLIEFPAAGVRELLASDPAFAREWASLLARQLHAARARLERLALRSAAERVLHYLQTEGRGPHCDVTLPGSLKDFARELGLAHESLYRTLSGLEGKGVLRRNGARLALNRKPSAM